MVAQELKAQVLLDSSDRWGHQSQGLKGFGPSEAASKWHSKDFHPQSIFTPSMLVPTIVVISTMCQSFDLVPHAHCFSEYWLQPRELAGTLPEEESETHVTQSLLTQNLVTRCIFLKVLKL